MPHLVENNRLNCHFKCGESRSKLKQLTASVDKLQPPSTVKSPVRMQQRSRNVAFELQDAGSEGSQDLHLGAKGCTIPRELAGGRQTELVRQMTTFVSLIGMLVFVECQRIGAIQVLIMLVAAIHTWNKHTLPVTQSKVQDSQHGYITVAVYVGVPLCYCLHYNLWSVSHYIAHTNYYVNYVSTR